MSMTQPHVRVQAPLVLENQIFKKTDEEPRQNNGLKNEQEDAKQTIREAEGVNIIHQVVAGVVRGFTLAVMQGVMNAIVEGLAGIIRAICFLLVGIIFGILFLVYSCTSNLHGSDCRDLNDYCFEYGIAIVIGVTLTLLLQLDFSDSNVVIALKTIIGISFAITFLVFWILFWVALEQDESCGELRTLVLVYNWIVVGGAIGLGCYYYIKIACKKKK